ncbi:hypothetical protein [Mycoplasma elephantis]|uniref:hypothetical protein n=1 Tax=Mycoplasma elephantis TaxID=114882 RepID=UPI000481B2E7|nr:hypothetical protein [Mycoplasma elephantis]
MKREIRRDIVGYYIPDVDQIMEKYDEKINLLEKENEDLRAKNIILEDTIQTKNNTISKLKNELLKMEIKFNETRSDEY